MFGTVTATRYYRAASNGRTRPQLIGGEYQNGRKVELFAKFSAGCDRGNNTLATEAIAAMLAADLRVPVPEPCVVEFDRDFINIIPAGDSRDLVKRSEPLAFGSVKLPLGFVTWPRGKHVDNVLFHEACSIYVFDALIANIDRKPSNPNCLVNGTEIGALDHDLAFITKGIIHWKPPWEAGGVQFLASNVNHIFFAELQGDERTSACIEIQRGRWKEINYARIDEYFAALPLSWAQASHTEEIIIYLKDLISNIDDSIDEIKRSLL